MSPLLHRIELCRSVVIELAKVHQIQPPSLRSISKAQLGGMKGGLKELVNYDINFTCSVSYFLAPNFLFCFLFPDDDCRKTVETSAYLF